MLNQYSAGIVIYTIKNNQPHYLLLHHGGKYWNFPKGKMEKGETGLEAAYREVEEETGIQKKDIRLYQNFQQHYYYRFYVEEGRMIYKKVTFFLGKVLEPKIQISDEHKGYFWFDYNHAKKLLRYKNSITLLQRTHNFISKSKISKNIQTKV